MMSKTSALFAGAAVLALLVSGCGVDDTAGEPGAVVDPDGQLSIFNCEPTTLLPTSSNEVCGGAVLHALFTPLVSYDYETSEARNALAESIESDDQQTWTITIRGGSTFHDGTPVTPQSFVSAWNYGAYGPNAQLNSYRYEPIAGYEDLQCEMDEDGQCIADPPSDELAGLAVVDDTTFTVTLTEPYSQFPLLLGTPAFYALPQAFFDDPEAFNEAPIGNGPFEMDGAWEHDRVIRVVRDDDYFGEPAAAARVEFRVYADMNTAYNDLLAGQLDVMSDMPPERVVDAPEQLGDRFLEGESSQLSYLGFPLYDERFADPDLRRALSMAVDREALVEALLPDQIPADGVLPPVVVGAREGACGQTCTHDPGRARELFEQAGGWDGPLTVWFAAGVGHEQPLEAIANQWAETLGITDVRFQALQPPDFGAQLTDRELDGPFRLGWVMDYPSPENYLTPLFGSTGGANDTAYENPDVDAAIRRGNRADTLDAALPAYHEAEDIILAEAPIIPLFFGRLTAAHSERVRNVTVDALTRIDTAAIEVLR